MQILKQLNRVATIKSLNLRLPFFKKLQKICYRFRAEFHFYQPEDHELL